MRYKVLRWSQYWTATSFFLSVEYHKQLMRLFCGSEPQGTTNRLVFPSHNSAALHGCAALNTVFVAYIVVGGDTRLIVESEKCHFRRLIDDATITAEARPVSMALRI